LGHQISACAKPEAMAGGGKDQEDEDRRFDQQELF